jgi:hypothetical protein
MLAGLVSRFASTHCQRTNDRMVLVAETNHQAKVSLGSSYIFHIRNSYFVLDGLMAMEIRPQLTEEVRHPAT